MANRKSVPVYRDIDGETRQVPYYCPIPIGLYEAARDFMSAEEFSATMRALMDHHFFRIDPDLRKLPSSCAIAYSDNVQFLEAKYNDWFASVKNGASTQADPKQTPNVPQIDPKGDKEKEKENEKENVYVNNAPARANTHAYGIKKNVYLTEEEYSELSEYSGLIDKVSLYIASSGKEYKDHHALAKMFYGKDPEQYPLIIPPKPKRTISKADYNEAVEQSGEMGLVREALEYFKIELPTAESTTSKGVNEDIDAYIKAQLRR